MLKIGRNVGLIRIKYSKTALDMQIMMQALKRRVYDEVRLLCVVACIRGLQVYIRAIRKSEDKQLK